MCVYIHIYCRTKNEKNKSEARAKTSYGKIGAMFAMDLTKWIQLARLVMIVLKTVSCLISEKDKKLIDKIVWCKHA